MSDDRLRKAISLAKQATEADREQNYEKAFDYYKRCLENWELVTKYETNPVLKKKLYEKIEPYMTRAETIKSYLTAQKKDMKTGDTQVNMTSSLNSKPEESLVSTLLVDKPNVSWNDVAGLEKAKEALQEAAILPTRFPHLFVGQRKPWKGILLYGPPGTGKTHLARACATEANATFISVSSADLISKWQGESEKLVRRLFEMARQKAPSIVFIDEVDSLCGSRNDREGESSRRVKTEFLVQMEGITPVFDPTKQVLVLGATNEPWSLDTAIRRRFERRIYIALPDARARKQMLLQYLQDTSHELQPADFHKISSQTEGFSGADIVTLVRDALFEPVRRCRVATHFKQVKNEGGIQWTPCAPNDNDSTKECRNLMSIPGDQLFPPKVTPMDFYTVLQSCKPSVSRDELTKHIEWTQEFGLEGR